MTTLSRKRQAVRVTLSRWRNSGCLIGCGKCVAWELGEVPYGHGAWNSQFAIKASDVP